MEVVAFMLIGALVLGTIAYLRSPTSGTTTRERLRFVGEKLRLHSELRDDSNYLETILEWKTDGIPTRFCYFRGPPVEEIFSSVQFDWHAPGFIRITRRGGAPLHSLFGVDDVSIDDRGFAARFRVVGKPGSQVAELFTDVARSHVIRLCDVSDPENGLVPFRVEIGPSVDVRARGNITCPFVDLTS